MKISLATNFDDSLIDRVKDYAIYEVYGKLNADLIGGGRPTNYLNKLELEKFEKHVAKVRESNINFNYLLNSACLMDKNQDDEWVSSVIDFMSYLKSVGVNACTITNPYLCELIKRHFKDDFIVRVSSFACVDTYEKAKFWDDFGADIICVDFCKVNRNFKMLKYMVDNLKCKIEILCTNSCLKECPMIHTHVNDIAHASNSIIDAKGYEDWGLNFCQEYQLNNLHEYIKSQWVRPEDIWAYEAIGIEHFKITERDFSTDALVKRTQAYVERRYDGNLLDLIQGSGFTASIDDDFEKKETFGNRQEVLAQINRIRGIGCIRKMNRHIYIDNAKIPTNFIDFFANGKCTGLCNECKYCYSIAKKVIVENEEVSEYLRDLYKKLNEMKY